MNFQPPWPFWFCTRFISISFILRRFLIPHPIRLHLTNALKIVFEIYIFHFTFFQTWHTYSIFLFQKRIMNYSRSSYSHHNLFRSVMMILLASNHCPGHVRSSYGIHFSSQVMILFKNSLLLFRVSCDKHTSKRCNFCSSGNWCDIHFTNSFSHYTQNWKLSLKIRLILRTFVCELASILAFNLIWLPHFQDSHFQNFWKSLINRIFSASWHILQQLYCDP